MASPEAAIFVPDKGDGTASLMKPQKPTLHRRGHDILDEDYHDDSFDEFKAAKLHIVANILFVFSSILYLACGAMVMDTYWWYKDVPRDVYWADDDATWWDYLINGTDDGFIPTDVYNATDDYTWQEWYNGTFPEDDTVFLAGGNYATAPWPDNYVSEYMIVIFWAGVGYLGYSAIEIFLSRNAPLNVRKLYYIMALAAILGLVSGILTNKAPAASNALNIISTHLWALDAIFIVMARYRGISAADEYDANKLVFGLGFNTWFWISDIAFLIGTGGDAITAWFWTWYDNYILAILAIIFAAMWLICSFIYLGMSIYDFKQFKSYYNLVDEYEKELEGMPAAATKGLDKTEKDDTPSSPPSSNEDAPEDEKKEDIEKTTEPAPDEVPRASTGDFYKDGCCAVP